MMETDRGEEWSDDEFYSQIHGNLIEDGHQNLNSDVSFSTSSTSYNQNHHETSATKEFPTHSDLVSCDCEKPDTFSLKCGVTEDNNTATENNQHVLERISDMKEKHANPTVFEAKLLTVVADSESGSDSENLPLSDLIKRKTMSLSSDFDDTTNDEDYVPSVSSNESDENLPIIQIQKRKRKWWRKRNRPIIRENKETIQRPVKNQPKQSKTKTAHTNVKRRKQMKQKKNESVSSTSDVDKAIEASRNTAQVYSLLKKHHEGRLNNILTSNSLRRVDVPADGNCFFSAVLKQLACENDIEVLRYKIKQHLLTYETHYICFLTKKYNMTDSEISSVYKEKTMQLSNDGIWDIELSDVIPLATANIYNRRLVIYSSRLSNPVINIEPDLEQTEPMSSEEPLLFAYLAVPGFEHYDACERIAVGDRITTEIGKPPSTNSASSPDSETLMSAKSMSNSEISSEINPSEATKIGQKQPVMTPRKHVDVRHQQPVITPRKRAAYRSPVKKNEVRKRVRDEEQWKKNIRKYRKKTGQSYYSPTAKKTVEAKSLKDIDCSNCKFKCADKISDEQRKELFDHFYNYEMTYERKRDFICRHIEVTSTGESGKRNLRTYKQNSRAYFLPIQEKRVRVCKQFFLCTLAVSDKLVRCTLSKKQHGTFAGSDGRGKHVPGNKTSEAKREYVKKHIESFPSVDSHYKRKETKRKFLAQGLSINKMYDLYKEKVEVEGKKDLEVSIFVYRDIFCKEYNISFHKPKKDQCEYCNMYKQKSETGTATEDDKISHEQHLHRTETARLEKEKDKEMAKADKSKFVATFDLQAVLYTPCSSVSKVYYKRKLNCYNLTFFSLADKKGTCYLWDETHGQRGSSEIGSCVITHLSCLPSTIKHVILYSDCCSGQNRNQYLAAGLLHTVVKHPTIEVIEQKFLESGHTQMECDSMHSAIDHAKQGAAIYIPDQWDTPIHYARRRNPYTVIPLRYDNFYDLKDFAQTECSGFKVDTEGCRINWLKVKVLQVSKAHPNEVRVKENFTDTEFKVLDVFKPTRGRPSLSKKPLKQKYSSKLPISVAKKKDLLSLCDSLIIPAYYKPFYEALPTSKTAADHLPDPDVLEKDIDSD